MSISRWSKRGFQSFQLGLLTLLLGFSASACARAGGMAQDLKIDPGSGKKIRVIVQFNKRGADSQSLAHLHGGEALLNHSLINGATLSIPQNALQRLAHDPKVAWVSPDRPLKGQWDCDIQAMGADQVWISPGYKGAGVGIAVLDTGVNLAQDFNHWNSHNSQLVAWLDLVNGSPTPYDDNGHGTHVAGIALGSGNSSQGVIGGSAPDANLIAVKVLDSQGSGTASTVISGLNWCVQNKDAYHIRVINLSLGHLPQESYTTDPLCAAVRSAIRAGIVVVCAAGNYGKNSAGQTIYGGIHCPGNDPSVITVGALNTWWTPTPSDDTVCTYSSRGPTLIDSLPKPDVVAPGNKIVSVLAPGSWLDTNYPQNEVVYSAGGPANYYMLSGTSMSTPEVTGVAALMLQANPTLAPNTVKGILMFTAQKLNLLDANGNPLTAGISVLTQGAGSVNALGAVEAAAKIDTSVAQGGYWLRAPLSKQTTLSGYNFNWSGQVLHGSDVLWSDQVMSIHQPLWSPDVLWADDVMWADNVLSADNGVTADQSTWGSQSLSADDVLWSDCAAQASYSSMNGD